jgi:hypothetical protein
MMNALKVSSDLQMKVLMDSVEEWRSVLMTFGGQCVMMDGI